ncbi:hypothetical protein Bca52824_064136 [Brassica carinata]|uniref:CBS domain-containing protein n=1 Tax=Brassica carinata TaxID=52824 RepID=A0A8X7U9V1_BRACI|nr:hypothetical protein Bca52824_064136 [Brassica carinata]
MASVFLYHVVGVDGGEARDGLSYTRRRRWNPLFVLSESRWSAASRFRGRDHRQHRFVGILSLLDIVAFLAKNKSKFLQEERGVLEKSPEAKWL